MRGRRGLCVFSVKSSTGAKKSALIWFMTTPTKILLFEDERPIAETLVYALKTEGFEAVHVTTAGEGLRALEAAQGEFSLVILDVGLPDMNGFEVCKRIRTFSSVPIFFLTARNAEIDKIVGLEIGADDYITKPFSPREVTTRVKAIFRRIETSKAASGPQEKTSASPTRWMRGPFAVDEEKYQVQLSGESLELTRYEYGLLTALMRAPGRVYSRTQLMEKVWESPDMSLERTVDTHVKGLRMKLRERDPREFIVTHRGIGYSFTEEFA